MGWSLSAEDQLGGLPASHGRCFRRNFHFPDADCGLAWKTVDVFGRREIRSGCGMKPALWETFCARFGILDTCVPLLAADGDGNVQARNISIAKKEILVRSAECESLILETTDQLISDWTSGAKRFDGMLYMMGSKQRGKFVPPYIGKTESTGRGGGLSVNIANLHTDKSKFARWGDNYAYHIGDLSACVLPGHADSKKVPKYRAWADCLFVDGSAKLREPVYLWATAWDRSQTGIWEEFGPTSLAFLEYLLIGVAGGISPRLLNREGVSR